ncbi:methyltransferase domain-containing protein [Streptomyces avicenniae]|uniref:methyltransferase domain-containing protein n=1 Tax=Streptomyces avicenniae TaxID=500153 RepID=UPI00069BC10C|nr:methyltransferase domain-containing protein [Streptomyces avicenniae]
MTSTIPAESSAELRHRMVVRLRAAHVLAPCWTDAFLDVPREPFVRCFAIRRPWGPQDYAPGDTGYLRAAYEDAPLTVRHDPTGTRAATVPAPTVTASALSALGNLQPGARVLEIATGTAWTTALLAEKVGANNVTSIDIDPRTISRARQALQRTGHTPRLLTGDGAHGHPHHAPYDALITTRRFPRIPSTWPVQVRPGGTLVARIGNALAALTVHHDGTATGPLLPTTAPPPDTRPAPTTSALLVRTGTRTTTVLPDITADTPALLRSVLQPDVHTHTFHRLGEHHRAVHCLTHPATGSWARIEPQGHNLHAVEHGGPRDLVHELTPLLTHWANHDHPTHAHYGLTLHPDGTHHLWHHTPDGPHWPLP